MKQIFTTIALLAMAFSFASCDKEIIVNCNCNCQCNNSNDSNDNPNRPGNPDDKDHGGNTGNDGGNSGDNGEINREDYENINITTFTQAQAGYYGIYYDGQPSNTSNWYLELAESTYDFENYEGEGYNICIDFFAKGTSSTNIPAGTYSIEAFEENKFSGGSISYGYIAEDEDYGEYPAGTWLFDGNDGIAGATAGIMTISSTGSTYFITYSFYDDEYMVAFNGSYEGKLTIYDGTQEYSYASSATKSSRSTAKHYRVRL